MIYPTKDCKYDLSVWCGNFRELEGGLAELSEKVDTIPQVDIAKVGQILEVEEVDESGKPIKWKAVNKSVTDRDLFEIRVANSDFYKNVKLSKTGVEEVLDGAGVTGFISTAGASKIKVTYSVLDFTMGSAVVEYDNDDNFVTRSVFFNGLAEEPMQKDYEATILLKPNTTRIRISVNKIDDSFCEIAFYDRAINEYFYSKDEIDAMFRDMLQT